MSQYLCIFSLILQGLLRKGANIRYLFYTTPKVLKLHESLIWNILKILGEESSRGGPPTIHKGGGRALRSCGPPGRPPTPIFCYMVCFDLEKNQKEAFGTKHRRLEVEPGETILGLRWSSSVEETSLREGEIITNVITNDPLIGRGSISINFFTSTISSQTLVHPLYPISVSKP